MVVPPQQKPPPRKSKPTYKLEEVQDLVSQALIGKTVVSRARETCGLESEREVKAYIRDCIKSLRSSNFAYSELQLYDDGSLWADIYGLENDEGSWFIKVSNEDNRLIIASCHALNKDIKCRDGKVIKAS